MRIDLTYVHLTHHVVPGPQSLSYFIPLILLPIALLIPRSLLAKWQNATAFLPIMVTCTIHAWMRMGGVDVISVDVLLWAALLLLLKDPWNDFRYVKGTGRAGGGRLEEVMDVDVATDLAEVKANGSVGEQVSTTTSGKDAAPNPSQHGQSYPSNLLERLPWVGTLLVSIRFNNWLIGIPSHDRYQPPAPAFHSHLHFVRHTILCFARGYLVLDLTRAYIYYDPYFTEVNMPIGSPLPFPQLSLLPPQFVRSMVIGAQAWALISQMFYLPCLLPVGLHALGCLGDDWSPHNWPPYFGSPEAIFLHGVRGFWGKYWHQKMRWSVSGPGYALADAMRLKAGGFARYAVITVVAFGLSGAVHMGLVPPEPLHATMPVNSIRLCVAAFFWVQPVAMLLEVVFIRVMASVTVLELWQHGRGLRIRKLINAMWVVLWFTITMSLLGGAGRQMGYWRVWTVPVSLWKGLRGEGWITWPFLLET